MIEIEVDEAHGVVEVTVQGPLDHLDMGRLAPSVDTYIAAHGKLNGLLLNVTAFTGWDSVEALIKHLTFAKNHHAKIVRVAAIGDRKWQAMVPRLAQRFVKAELRYFDQADAEAAAKWVRGG